MRHYDANDQYDRDEAATIKAESWMLALLEMNPDYRSWGPGEDYMEIRGSGWDASKEFASWADFGPFHLDNLNECVNFYFEIERPSVTCPKDCTGYNAATKQIADDWFDFDGLGRKWVHAITQDEVDALWEKKRLFDFKDKPTAEQVNKWSAAKGLGHDAINRWICVETRARRLGVWGHCETCDGRGSVFTEPHAHVNLVAWILHPRKGCSRGVRVRLEQSELDAVFAWLRDAAHRNADRFGKLPQTVTA